MSVEVETSLQLSSEGEIFVRSYYCDRMINEAYDHPRHAIGAQSDQSKPGRPHGYIYDFRFPIFDLKPIQCQFHMKTGMKINFKEQIIIYFR